MGPRERLIRMLRDVMTKEEFATFFKKAGRRGGLIGGKRAAEAMTAEQRRARAAKASRARWKKYRAAGKPRSKPRRPG